MSMSDGTTTNLDQQQQQQQQAEQARIEEKKRISDEEKRINVDEYYASQKKFWKYFGFSVGLIVSLLFSGSSIMNYFDSNPNSYYKDKKKLLIGETTFFSLLVITFITLIILTNKDII